MPLHPSTGGGSGLEPVLLWPFSALPVSLRAPSTRHEQGCSRPSSTAWARELSVSKTISTVTSGAGLSPPPPHATLPTGAGCQTLLWGWGAPLCGTPFLCPLGLSGFLWAPLKADGRGVCVCAWALSGAAGCASAWCCPRRGLCPWIPRGAGVPGVCRRQVMSCVEWSGVLCHPPGPTLSPAAGSHRLCSSRSLLLQSWSPARPARHCPCSALLPGEPRPCRGPGLAGMGPRGAQGAAWPFFPALVPASACSCMGSASLPKYRQGDGDGVCWGQPLHPALRGGWHWAGAVAWGEPQPAPALLPAEGGTDPST